MKKEMFEQLLESVREGTEILAGQRTPSRQFAYPEPDVRSIREEHGLTQQNFAVMLGISVATLRNWEQGRRKPEGPARVLLQVAAKHPEAIWDSIRSQQ